jgi:hypothetical protein
VLDSQTAARFARGLFATLCIMNIDALLPELREAHILASQFEGGYSERFFGAQEFAHALGNAIAELEQGNLSVLSDLQLWFFPTSDWDDFVKSDGIELGQRISDMLSELA